MMTRPLTADARDARLRDTPLIGAAGLDLLRHSMVAILGMGNIGGQLAPHFALLGIPLLLIDRDIVEPGNLGTQAFAEADIGSSKVQARARALAALNPECPLAPVHADIRDLGAGALRRADLICCCLDSAAIRIVVNELAMRLAIPWLDGALDGSGERSFGRVALYNTRDSQSGCYLCPHTGRTLAQMLRESDGATGCSAARTPQANASAAPTLAISALGAAVASVQAAWGLDLLLRHRADAAGREVYFDLDAGRMTVHRLTRNPRCLFEHRKYALVSIGADATQATIGQTFEAAERHLGSPITLELQRRVLVAAVRCAACGDLRHPYRVASAITSAELACACGGTREPVPGELLERFGQEEAAGFLDRTWAEAGLPHSDVVVATRDDEEIAFLLEPE